jgi:uncharacterized protein (DUF433 family)
MSTVDYAHISLDSENVPILTGTRIKVVEIVLDHLADGSNAEEIHREYPWLSLGQIHSALGFYYDHKEEVDRDIARRLEKVEEIKARWVDSPLAKKLKALKYPS